MIILFHSHVNPAGWLLLLVSFPDKDPETQRGDVTVQGKGSKRKRWSWDSDAAPMSQRLRFPSHSTPPGANRGPRVGGGWGGTGMQRLGVANKL